MKGNLSDVEEYLNKMYGDFIQKVETDPETEPVEPDFSPSGSEESKPIVDD